MPSGTVLEIVDESDAVIGVRSREEIHTLGLRHREVHVWLVTPDNDIIFQRRSATKDTFPNQLDASAGGHVHDGRRRRSAKARNRGIWGGAAQRGLWGFSHSVAVEIGRKPI